MAANKSTNKAIGAHEFSYNAIWSLRHAGGTSFYMYNELNKMYIGLPTDNGTNLHENVASAAAYTFEVVDAEKNTVELHTNGATLHASNHNDDKLLNWDGNEGASRWTITTIDLSAEKLAALDALQAAYNEKAVYKNAVMGTALGQYTGDVDAVKAALPAAETILNKSLFEQASVALADITAATEALNAVTAPAINMPAAGKYYRIKSAYEDQLLSGYYISGEYNQDKGRIACKEAADASTILYLTEDNKLVAYQSGLTIGLSNSNWTFASIDDNSNPATTITFAGSSRTAGAYTVKSADKYLHYETTTWFGDPSAQVNRCSEDTDPKHDWYIEEVTELPVSISAAGYATFYAPVAVSVPSGVTAHTVTVDGNVAYLNEIGATIPANTGVVLVAGEGSYNFAVTTAAAFEGTNLMAGTVAKTLVTKEDAECYVLANGAEGVGLYAAVKGEDATKFYNAGHKAYLKVEKNANPAAQYSFRFGEGTTGIENVESAEAVKAIFDLTGRRVEAVTAPGIYIVNGKKVLVK